MAYLAAFANLLAGALTLIVLRRGLPPRSLAHRVAFISSHVVWWRVGWLGWSLAAISLLGLFLALAGRFRTVAPLLCGLVIVVSPAGLAADLRADALLAGFTSPAAPNVSLVRSE